MILRSFALLTREDLMFEGPVLGRAGFECLILLV